MTVILPTNVCTVTPTCKQSFDCPLIPTNCKDGILYLDWCQPDHIDIQLGCDPYNQIALFTQNVTEIEIELSYRNNGNVVRSLMDAEIADATTRWSDVDDFNKRFSLSALDSAAFPAGRMQGVIYITTVDGRYMSHKFAIINKRYVLSAPVLCITGPDDDIDTTNPITIAGLTVTLYFHNSDILHADRTAESITIDWGDGTAADVIPAANLVTQDNANWLQAHTYATAGDYDVRVEFALNYDNTNACDQELITVSEFTLCDLSA